MARSRRTGTIKGRGFYKGFSRQVGALAGSLAGASLGAPTLGGFAGGYLGQKVSDITGFGAYTLPGKLSVRKNSLVLPMNPRIKNDLEREGAVVITHREHIGSIKSSTDFQVQFELPINPAQNGTFPWLSGVASEFTMWEPLGMVFEYVSTSGNAVSSTNNALGEVIMTVNANSNDSSYVSKTQMLNADFAQAFAPSKNGACPVECSPQLSALTKLYTRYGAKKEGSDIRMSDIGVLTVATAGMQAADIELGELYVTYQVALFKPQLVQELGFLIPQASYALSNPASATPLGSTHVKLVDTIGITFASANKIVIPRNTSGKFHMNINYQGLSAALTRFDVTYVNATAIDAWKGGTSGFIDDTGNFADTYMADYAFVVDDSSKEVEINFSSGAQLPLSISTASLWISQMNWDVTD